MLDLYGGTSGTYAGLDRFGRTIDHRWYDYTSGTVDRARYYYGYDYASNRRVAPVARLPGPRSRERLQRTVNA
ncbi:MAG: hypothetical protein AB7Q45_21445 [Planctomycetaceae bacterium]